ncbi:PqqD family protein [Paenibacillus glucanolyticus]|jgi:hypothetical protein|uniref:PqqD family protein n=1 Tax=Paenibacillus glucanolyticus TaxID=59843 RepID=UPI00128B4BAA|nr:PqqD family protein [Paenibacillus glucanolyticus]MPY19704.1 PqqD family protein [Paenibacillus glucanolyticus]
MMISQKEEVYTTVHDQEVVLLDMNQGKYFGLEGAAMALWNELSQGPVTTSAILEKWKTIYDQEEDELNSLLTQSLEELTAKRLVVVDT